MLDRIVFAGVTNSSFVAASEDLEKLADLEVSPKQVERVTKRIGSERCVERAEAVASYQELPLTERKQAPANVTPPDVAVVGTDGGRLQIRDAEDETDETDVDDKPADETKGTQWREDKIGILLTMKSDVSATDPCPQIPENFVDPTRILKLARELKKRPALGDEGLKEPATAQAEEAPHDPDSKWKPPEVETRNLLATRGSWESFGPIVATEAWSKGFYAAERRAFIGDGSDNNWTLWRRHFSSFVPILDFIHALSYVFASATAGRPFAEGWPCYVQWIDWIWQGHVEKVIAALALRQEELGLPEANESESCPRRIVAKALGYLQNNKDRMRYHEYRIQGLPMMSSYVESAVKQFNQRVKGTEKFWSEEGAESILQLRADHLSDDQRLEAFWESRQANETGQRRRRRAA